MGKMMQYVIMILIAVTISGQELPKIGVRGGLGTDINLGLAYGLGGNYLLNVSDKTLELGLMVFGGSSAESTTEGLHTYDETTEVFVVSMLANYLIGYDPDQSSLFFISGVGLASISVEWEESSTTDVSLGPLLPGGGSMQSAEGSSGGSILNLGVGKTLQNNLDFRVEFPIIVTFAPPGGAAAVVPSAIATLGYRF